MRQGVVPDKCTGYRLNDVDGHPRIGHHYWEPACPVHQTELIVVLKEQT